jgi:hypothetical protein
MRQVTYTDKFGYKKVALVRDTDPDDFAEQGVPVGPPDLELVDWEEVKRDLNNILVDRGILTYHDIQRNPSAVSSAVRSCLTSKVVNVYKFMEGTQ